MKNENFTLSLLVDQTPEEVFKAVTNVRGWWSEEINGGTEKLNDEFDYRYGDVHACKVKLIEVIPNQKVTWQVLENYFSFTEDKKEWTGTTVDFNILSHLGKTKLMFTHIGLVPEYECFSACSAGWTQYIEKSLQQLIMTGKGQPNSRETAYTTHEVAAKFNRLAKQEKWFDIQDELFSEDVKSIEPKHSIYFKDVQGKALVRKKGEDWVKRIEAAHRRHTTEPIVAGNRFAVGREVDITVHGLGRIQINEIMMYEVKDGKIVKEEFFY